MKILASNEAVLREKYLTVLEQINAVEVSEEIAVAPAEDGSKILTIQGAERCWRLNSRLDPAEAAKIYADRYKIRPFATYFVFGLSDGRHIRELLKRCDKTNRIIVGEPDVRLFAMACTHFDLTDLLCDDRIHLYIPDVTRPVEDIIEATMKYEDLKTMEFCILPGYDVLYAPQCEKFMDGISERILHESVRKGTSVGFNRVIPQNTLYNMKHMIRHKNIAQIREKLEAYDLTGIPAIIVSAGPSLDKNVHELKAAEGKALIVVVDAALRTVLRAGIRPDLVCTVDPQTPERFFDGMEGLGDLNWFCNRLSRPVNLERHARNIYYYGPFEEGWNELVGEELGYMLPDLPSGGNITSVAFSLACYLGFRKLVLIGQDMAFTNGVSHTSGVGDALGGNEKYIASRMLVQVEGIDGTMLDTDFQMWYYKQWFEKIIRINQNTIEVTDATEGGARIGGTQIRTLHDVILESCNGELNFAELEREIEPAFSEGQQEKLLGCFNGMEQQALNLQEKIGEILRVQKRSAENLKSSSVSAGEERAALERMVQDNGQLERMPLFEMMTQYAQEEEYELGDSIYAQEEMSAADLLEQSIALYQGYERAIVMLLEDIRESLSA